MCGLATLTSTVTSKASLRSSVSARSIWPARIGTTLTETSLSLLVDASSRKRAASYGVEETARFRVRYATQPSYELGPASAQLEPIDDGMGGLHVQFDHSSTYNGDPSQSLCPGPMRVGSER